MQRNFNNNKHCFQATSSGLNIKPSSGWNLKRAGEFKRSNPALPWDAQISFIFTCSLFSTEIYNFRANTTLLHKI